MLYDTDVSVKTYQDWRLSVDFLDDASMSYFGDLQGASVVDFGCGGGSFLKKCIAKGATNCLGIDYSESMIKSAINATKQERDKVRFVVEDCLKPFDNTYGQFDFAACTFVVPSCEDEERLRNLFGNIFRCLKPNGKAVISHDSLPTTVKDQQALIKIAGFLVPLQSEAEGTDPARVVTTLTESGDASGSLLTFHENYWSVEKVKKNLENLGFTKIWHSYPRWSDFMPLEESKQLDVMGDPRCLSFVIALKSA